MAKYFKYIQSSIKMIQMIFKIFGKKKQKFSLQL